MCNTAAHLVDRVAPNVPVRQWVLSLPFELRRLVAFRADVLTAVARIFFETVSADYRRRSGVGSPRAGAVTCVQRFGGSLNLNPHLHVIWLDGVFTFDEGTTRFHPAEPPNRECLERIVRHVARRVVRWLGRKGLLDERVREERSNVPETATSLDACAHVALAPGGFGSAGSPTPAPDDHDEARWSHRQQRFTAEHERFNLHAGVHIPASDDDGRERLCRYALRPCFALKRLSTLPDNRVAYQVKAPRSRRTTHRLMTPLEFLARASALIPPPRFPLVRYHGVLAPNSPHRARVVPRPLAWLPNKCGSRRAAEKHARNARHPDRATSSGTRTPTAGSTVASHTLPCDQKGVTTPAVRLGNLITSSSPTSVSSPSETATVVTFGADGDLPPNMLPIRHWNRLLGGLLLCTSPRLDWATLMRRTHATDVLECSQCQGRLRVLAAITEPDVAREILIRLGQATTAPRPARARDPTWEDGTQTDVPAAE